MDITERKSLKVGDGIIVKTGRGYQYAHVVSANPFRVRKWLKRSKRWTQSMFVFKDEIMRMAVVSDFGETSYNPDFSKLTSNRIV